MRLTILDRGSVSQRLLLLVIRVMSGEKAPDIVRVLRHRRDLFGERFEQELQRALRGPSEWSVAERELIAAYVSHVNRCRFCAGIHGEVARAADAELPLEEVFRDPASAPIRGELRAALLFSAKLTLEPGAVVADDARAVRETGASESQLEDVVRIVGLLNVINRLADALGAHVPTPEALVGGSRFMLKRGYS
jgi:uncharacterized peroxidase-related enzyme